MKLSRIVFLLLCVSLLARIAPAEVRLPHVISDHAVLQRNSPIHIWGWATPSAHLTIRFHAQSVSAVASDMGEWSAYLAPETAGGPYTLTVSGDGPDVTVEDLLVGDVWIASGQSNMEMPMGGFPNSAVLKNADQEIAAATHPNLRLLVVDHQASDVPLDDEPDTWTACTPETARKFSAVGYFFGREIAAKENVPVGLIDSTWGGTPADSWVSMDTLGTHPDLLPAFAARANFADEQSDLNARIAAEKAATAAALAAGKPKPQFPWHPDEVSWSPAGLYNGMIAPLTPLSIRGFIWYQGETNSAHDRAPYYKTLFSGMIGDWRMHFAQGTLPFYFVQIASFNSPGEDWGRVRDAQRRTLDLANTGMAVTLDVGSADNVHPPDKQTVGHRLALAARAITYGENVAYASPLFREATPELQPDGTTAMQVWFDHAQGLTAHGTAMTGFEVAGADHHFVPAQAHIDGETVLVTSTEMPHPVYVRYGWMGVMADNLFNAAGLPMSTFTSETFPAD
ncbi:MAG TPA: sialate O-acetylesterase [Acidobacteriaceae bacterium]|jgi:sialate O-acetylesterase|nr:sialate O-acetylesterase [Acidobacteriaceae bacterium]